MAALLEIRNLRTSFFTDEGEAKAVDNVSYDIQEGEFVALVGESGCGKSVSALSVMRLVPFPPGRIIGGEILLNGRDLLKLSEQEMRGVRGNEIGMVFQEPMTSLNPVFTIGHQIVETIRAHKDIDKQAAWRRAVELLELVGIPQPTDRMADYPHQFSGGMRQRVMIAMALSCEPKLVIADEPTTALDVTIQAQVLELLESVAEQLSTAVLLITHNLGVVARYAHRVNVMYAGKIVEQATADEIYHNPRHPYTLGLLQSVPRMDRVEGSRLSTIEGLPPSLLRLPGGCYFHPRCPFIVERCEREEPPAMLVTDDHTAACWQWNEVDIGDSTVVKSK
ncbi:MAG: ABC transporter ATP-binding protein [Dehalococcoidia bacterium]|nr:ABC transporter ATP-binding protein [Dehalococcoidia bacterium]